MTKKYVKLNGILDINNAINKIIKKAICEKPTDTNLIIGNNSTLNTTFLTK